MKIANVFSSQAFAPISHIVCHIVWPLLEIVLRLTHNPSSVPVKCLYIGTLSWPSACRLQSGDKTCILMTSLKGETRPRSSFLILQMFSTEWAGKTYSQSRVIYQRHTNCRILSYQGKQQCIIHSGAQSSGERVFSSRSVETGREKNCIWSSLSSSTDEDLICWQCWASIKEHVYWKKKMIWAYFQGEKRFQGQLAGQRCYRTLAYVKTFFFVTNLHRGICPH